MMSTTTNSAQFTAPNVSTENSAPKGERVRHIKPLTSLRFFAAMAIIMHHAKDSFAGWAAISDGFVFQHMMSFFFVLSGFILTLNYHHLSGAKDTIKFFLARIGRIWPAQVFSNLLLIALLPEVFRVSATNFKYLAANILLVHAWIPDSKFYFSFNAPSWSNSTEFFFYLFFPLLIVALKKRWYLAVVPTTACLAAMIAYCNYMHLPEFASGFCNQALLYVNPIGRVIEFAVGIATALFFIRHGSKLKLNPMLATIIEIGLISAFLFLNYYAVIIRMYAEPYLGTAGAYWLYITGLPLLTVSGILTILSTERGLLAKLLSFPFLVLIGDLSFGAYMLHCIFLPFHGLYMPFANSVQDGFLFLAILYLSAHLMSKLIEQPMRRSIQSLGQLLNSPNGQEKQKNLPIAKVSSAQPNSLQSNSLQSKIKLGLEVLVLGGLIYIAIPGINRISVADATALAASGTGQNIHFKQADDLKRKKTFKSHVMLKSAEVHKDGKTVKVTLIWQALQDHTVDMTDEINLLDASGSSIKRSTHIQDMRFNSVKAGDTWKDSFQFDTGDYSKAEKISLRILRARLWPLICEGGKTGAIGELIIPVTKSLAHSASL